MKIRIRNNISVIIVFGILIFLGVAYLRGHFNEVGHYKYLNDEAKIKLEGSNYSVKTPHYYNYKLVCFEQERKKYNKNDYGTITITYKNDDKYFCYKSKKLKSGYDEKDYPGTYRAINGETTLEIPYDKIELSNTTLYYIPKDKYDFHLGSIYYWIIDDISYSTNEFNNIEHEDVVKLIESMS